MTMTDLGSGHLPQYGSSVSMKYSNVSVSVSLRTPKKMYHAIFSVGGENLEPPTSMESLDLMRPISAGSSSLTLGPHASVHPCLVYEDQLFGTREEYFVHVFITQVVLRSRAIFMSLT